MPDILTFAVIVGVPLVVMLVLAVRYFPMDLVYLNTRFNVIGNPNMSRTRLADALATDDQREAAKRLATKYFPIEDATGPADAEARMNTVNRQLLDEALDKVPGRVRPFYAIMMMYHEIDEVRAACAALNDGRTPAVATVGRIDSGTAEAMGRCETTSEIIGTYLHAIDVNAGDEPTDADLDTAYLGAMAGAVKMLGGVSGGPLRTILRTRMDSELVLVALRMHLHGRLSDLGALPEGYAVAPWMLVEIAADPAKGIGSLAGTDLEVVSDMRDPIEIERALRRMTFDLADRVYMRKFMTIGPLTRFLMFREIETANVHAVLMGAATGLDWSTVQKAVVTEEPA